MNLPEIQNPWIRRPLIAAIPFLIVWGVVRHTACAFGEACVEFTREIPEAISLLWKGVPKRRYG